jgi:hypothetical protein
MESSINTSSPVTYCYVGTAKVSDSDAQPPSEWLERDEQELGLNFVKLPVSDHVRRLRDH